ncbi:MAG: hypothetical protein VSS75_003045 [Candidatus Parabeggiatoa sp.]|nr:hypothetical protein [Candidatus Parabeggiatoa sp.]
MSYILDALKKAEREREMVQFIDYNNRQAQNKWLVLPKIRSMPWMSIILAMNVLLLILLLWPKAPLVAPQVYIVPPVINNQPLLDN